MVCHNPEKSRFVKTQTLVSHEIHGTSFIHQDIFDEANEDQVWQGPSRAKTNVKQCFHAGRMSGLHLQSWFADLIPTSAVPMKTQSVNFQF